MLATFSKGMKAIDKRDNALKKLKIDDDLKTQENNVTLEKIF